MSLGKPTGSRDAFLQQQSGTNYLLVAGGPIISKISGEKVYAENQSGQALWVIQSGLIEALSGLSVVLESGTTVNLQSGETITAEVSGQKVYTETQSGQALFVQMSGVTDLISGLGVLISGQTVDIGTPTSVLRAKNIVGAISGGIQITSGITISATVRAPTWNSGDIYLGGSNLAAGYRPYSGVGMQLEPGDAQSMDIDNFNRIYAFAAISGDEVLVIGVVK